MKAEQEDVHFIAEHIIDGELNGHFMNYDNSKNKSMLCMSLSQTIETSLAQTILFDGSVEAKHQNYLIYGSEKTGTIGFFCIMVECDNTPNSEIEILLFAIDKNYRNRGHGTNMLRIALELIKRNKFNAVTIRCYPKSKNMAALLKRFNFEYLEKDEGGANIYICPI